MSMKILDPTTHPVASNPALASRCSTLSGTKVGILWNGKSFGGELLTQITAVLNKKHGLELVAFFKKAYIGNIAPKEYFDGMVAKKVDWALVGFGD